MQEWLDLWDYRRRVERLYAAARGTPDPEAAWLHWRRERDELFATHPQSAVPEGSRSSFSGLSFFPYHPGWRFHATVEPGDRAPHEIGHSGAGTTGFIAFGQVHLDTPEGRVSLSLYWLDTYGGGVFLPFRDRTNGSETYGGGRYLLDSAKGADLGHAGYRVVLDFNFSYHPSCVHDPRWSCPLAPASNRLDVRVPAGERLGAPHPVGETAPGVG